MRGIARTHLFIFLCGLLAACSAIPFSTLWKMRHFSMGDVLALNPGQVRVAVAFDPPVKLAADKNRLTLSLSENGARRDYAFALESAAEAAGPDAHHAWTLMRLTPASAGQLAALQSRVREHPSDFTFREFSWTGGNLDFPDKRPSSLHMSVSLRLRATDEWVPLLADYPVRVTYEQGQ